ncbi:hypothetical protein JK167_13890 [Levilactobacillus brevis]|uniref:MucBP domain protein n=1 Tax=Levilactobacillus brevis TaxID=1580 RepID=A0AA41ES52_LEVBR|nr:DUF5776 domain-containing protein [Levilactobacillus brevis]MBS0948717.1 hypothetical protein [Levilactobacillus brevis]MBS1011881.1 hypothetical protein [Levilactobacillus brevis]
MGYHYATTTDELNGQVQPDELTVGSENPVTTIYVAGDDASAKINFVDTQSGAALPDSSITLTGYVGQAPTSGNEFLLPKNYKLDPTTQPNQAAFTSKVNNDGSTTITYTQELALSNNDIQINLVHDTTEATETKSIKRTIKFVDINNQSVSPSVVQTVNFVRTVTTDKVDGAVQYGEWLAEAGTSFPSFSSPDVTGMFSDVQTVSEQAGITPESNDSEIVIHYYSKGQTVEPTDPKDPGTPVDPNNPDGPKWPDGVDKDSLNQTATRTIHYVDANGKQLADDVVQTVQLSRSATVDFSDPAKPTVTYGAWEAAGSFASVTSPTVKGYVTTQSSVGEVTPSAPASSSETVKYITGGQTVEPTDPKDPGTPVDPNNPDGPKWPDGVDKDSLNQTATRTIHYVDVNGKQLADDVVQTVKLSRSATVDFSDPAKPTVTYGAWEAAGSFASVTSPTVKGYTPNPRQVDIVTPISAGVIEVTVHYTVNAEKPNKPGKKPKPKVTELKKYGSVKKGSAVYAVKHIYLYRDKSFKRSARLVSYARQSRINRPMFVVKRIVKLESGKILYQVKDVNHKSKTAGKVGYITVNTNYVKPVYYLAKHKTITVINAKGINGYKAKNLKGKVKHYKQGMVLHVKKIVTHNATTRYILTNGQYITANRKLVKMDKQKFAGEIKTTHALNVYRDVNLTKRTVGNKSIRRGVKVKIKRLEYSKANDVSTYGAKRYLVKGGYISGNRSWLKILKLK